MATYYDEKQKTWYCKFRYKNWQGQSKSTCKRGFARKKDAIAYEMRYKEQAVNKPNITLADLVSEYLANFKIRNKESTYRTKKNILDKHIVPTLGNMQIDKITPLIIQKWQDNLQTSHTFSDGYLHTINACFKTVLNYAVKFYNLPINPFIRTEPIGKTSRRVVFLENDEWKKIDDYLKENDFVYRVIANIMYWSGMRIGECLALTRNDIDFTANTISISKSVSVLGKITTPKTKSSVRTISMPQFVMDMIKELFDKCYSIEYLKDIHSRNGVCDRFIRIGKKLGIKLSSHVFRHSHASFLINQSVPITAIAKRLGHATPAITLKTYAHCFKEQDKQIVDKINAFVGQM